jgi:hypothetical protein
MPKDKKKFKKYKQGRKPEKSKSHDVETEYKEKNNKNGDEDLE